MSVVPWSSLSHRLNFQENTNALLFAENLSINCSFWHWEVQVAYPAISTILDANPIGNRPAEFLLLWAIAAQDCYVHGESENHGRFVRQNLNRLRNTFEYWLFMLRFKFTVVLDCMNLCLEFSEVCDSGLVLDFEEELLNTF